MASELPIDDGLENELVRQIEERIDEMIGLLVRKKDVLIDEVRNKQKQLQATKAERAKYIQDIEKLFSEVQQNTNNDLFSQIEAQLKFLKKEPPLQLDLKFIPRPIDDFNEYIEEDLYLSEGKILQLPQRAMRVFGEGLLNGPMKLAFDPWDGCKSIYIPDANNRIIQVFSQRGDKMFEFGYGSLVFPCAVTLDKENCYVADSAGRAIHQFAKKDYKLTRLQRDTPRSEFTQLSYPVDIKFDSGYLYVADLEHNRVCVFTHELEFVRQFGCGTLIKPQYIQFHKDGNIFVLDGGTEYFLHVFNRKYEIISRFKKKGPLPALVNPKSFCFGPNYTSIIVADFDASTVKHLELRKDRLIQRSVIGKQSPGSDVVGGCMGVVLVDNFIIVSCQKPNSCLKVFSLDNVKV